MGNAAISAKRDRNFSYSIDGNLINKQNNNNNDENKNNLDFVKKKQFLYQQSLDTSDDVEEIKVIF